MILKVLFWNREIGVCVHGLGLATTVGLPCRRTALAVWTVCPIAVPKTLAAALTRMVRVRALLVSHSFGSMSHVSNIHIINYIYNIFIFIYIFIHLLIDSFIFY